MSKYNEGRQPCEEFDAEEITLYGFTEHECFAPFDMPYPAARCGQLVAWCRNCHKDHHANGYDTCRGTTKWGDRTLVDR